MQPELSVIVPVYNEASSLESFIHTWLTFLKTLVPHFEIVVMNDGSTDGTGRILDRLRKENLNIRVTHQLRNGHSEAIRRGIETAKGKYLLFLDANGRYETCDFERFWAEKGMARFVIGNRTHRLDTLPRRILNSLLNAWARLLFKSQLHDGNISFRLIERETAIKYASILPKELESFNLVLALLVKQEIPGLVKEIKIPYRKRTVGVSSTSFYKFFSLHMRYARELFSVRLQRRKIENRALILQESY